MTYIIETDGIEALLNSRRCINILNDLVPERQEEIVLVRHVFDHDLVRILITAYSGNQTVRQQAINRLNDELIRSVRISESASADICGTFVKVLQWDVTIPNDEKKRKQKEKEKQERKEQRRTIWKWILQRWKAILILLACLTLFVVLYSPVRTMIDHIGKVHWKLAETQYVGRNYEEVKTELEKLGFHTVLVKEIADIAVVHSGEEYCVSQITINGNESLSSDQWYPADDPVIIYYHVLSDDYSFELPFSSTDFKWLNIDDAEKKLKDAGFQTITKEEHKDLKLGQRDLIGAVKYIYINDEFQFNKGDLKPHNAEIRIVYHGYALKYLTPIPKSLNDMLGMDYKILQKELSEAGFTDVSTTETEDITNENESKYKYKTVSDVMINGKDDYQKNDTIPIDSEIVICYHTYSDKYRLFTPDSAVNLKGQNYLDVVRIMQDAGFSGIEIDKLHDIKIGVLTKEGEVESVSVNGDTGFSQGAAYPRNAKVVITYHTK